MYWFLVNWKEIFGEIANVMKISSLGFHLSETFYVRMRGKRSWITKKSAPFLIWAEYVQVQAIKYGKSLIPRKSLHSTEKLENPVGKNKHFRMFWLFLTWPSHLRPIYLFGRFFNSNFAWVTHKWHFGVGVLLQICCIFSEYIFLRLPMEGWFWASNNSLCSPWYPPNK